MKKMGRIEVICGPMCCGKSEELLRRMRRRVIAGYGHFCYTPERGRKPGKICCRGGDEVEAAPITNATKIIEGLNLDHITTSVFVFDEAQWLGGLMVTAEMLAQAGHRVLIAGLDMDWQGNPFMELARVMAIAERVDKLTAVCKRCGGDATHTARLGDGNDEGGIWEPMCRQHWQAHREKQRLPTT